MPTPLSRQPSGHDVSYPYQCDVERDARPIRNNLTRPSEARSDEWIQVIFEKLFKNSIYFVMPSYFSFPSTIIATRPGAQIIALPGLEILPVAIHIFCGQFASTTNTEPSEIRMRVGPTALSIVRVVSDNSATSATVFPRQTTRTDSPFPDDKNSGIPASIIAKARGIMSPGRGFNLRWSIAR